MPLKPHNQHLDLVLNETETEQVPIDFVWYRLLVIGNDHDDLIYYYFIIALCVPLEISNIFNNSLALGSYRNNFTSIHLKLI